MPARKGICRRALLLALACGVIPTLATTQPQSKTAIPRTAEEMAAVRRDVWGEAALRHPEGPSHEFFKDLLPPLRYVNTAFRHYPIVLSAPGASVKARWVSNGSALNARADKKPMWREVGFPVRFRVGEESLPFGEDLDHLNGARYVEGYLPVVQAAYTQGKAVYEQEAFASVGALAEHGAVLVRFTVRGAPGSITAQVDHAGLLSMVEESIRDAKGQGLVLFDGNWRWSEATKELRATLPPDGSATLMILTQPLAPPLPKFNADRYEKERKACVECWKSLLARGMKLQVPEPLVNDAWRALIIGNFVIANGDRMNYSAGNAYDHLYEGECGDAVRALMLYGFTQDARQMVGPLLDFQRQATRYHVAGHKLQLLAHYYWVTRDAEYLRSKEPIWRPVVEFIVTSRKTENGLLPKDNYAGDINQQVYSLNSNGNCWRGLRDMAAVLADLGEIDRAKQLHREAAAFREAILDAVAKSEQRDTKPPFIPNALFGVEKAHDPLTATRLGSYYDLMAPYIIGSGIFGPGSEREAWLIEYLREHGGTAMGMIRSMPHQGEFDKQPGVNVLYGLRYMLAQLRRDERNHALVGFYGQLAQGMTRDTFIGGEGSRFFHGDRWGRSFYLPPNSASNAMFLTTLRYLLIQDWDLDDDGQAETLRLLYGAPSRWLKDGAVIDVKRAPTMFGEVSCRVESHLDEGQVVVTVEPPRRSPAKLLLRLPLPTGWKAISAKVGDTPLALGPDGAADLTSHKEQVTVHFRVDKAMR